MKRGRRIWAPLAALVGLALVAGCAAGPPSEYLRPQGDGVTGRVGDLVVTNALLYGGEAGEVPLGGSTIVRATIVNEGDVPDRLLTITSPVATTGMIVGEPSVPARGVLSTGYGPGLPPPPGTAPVALQLTGLTTAVRLGLTYPVDLTFAGSGPIRLELPVADPADLRSG